MSPAERSMLPGPRPSTVKQGAISLPMGCAEREVKPSNNRFEKAQEDRSKRRCFSSFLCPSDVGMYGRDASEPPVRREVKSSDDGNQNRQNEQPPGIWQRRELGASRLLDGRNRGIGG